MDYLNFYKLDADPFRNEPDTRFYFEGEVQKQARMRLARAIEQRKGLAVLVAGQGCGKTTMAHHILDGLSGGKYATRMLSVPHPDCGQGWLLPEINRAFGVSEPAKDPVGTLTQLSNVLVGLATKAKHPVLLLDEAHLLSNQAVLTELRPILNLLHRGRKLISLVLFGLPELDKSLRLDASVAQRIDVRVEMGTMDREASTTYVQHRLTCVGGSADLFNQDAVDSLFIYTTGVPRLINTLADNALYEGFLEQSPRITRSLVMVAAEQLGMEARELKVSSVVGRPPRPQTPRPQAPRSASPLLAPKLPAPAAAKRVTPPPTPKPPAPAASMLELDDDDASLDSLSVITSPDIASSEDLVLMSAMDDVEADTGTQGTGDEDFDSWLADWQNQEEKSAGQKPEKKEKVDLLTQSANLEDDSLNTFENLWSELEESGHFEPLDEPVPSPAKKPAPDVPSDEETTLAGLPADPSLEAPSKPSIRKTAQAGADEIDALFDEIQIRD